MTQRLPNGLHAHTGYWLDRLRSLVSGGFEAALAAQDVTVAQWSVLTTLYRGEARTPRELAAFIAVDAGALTRLLDRLEAKGLLRRVPAPGDRRSLHLELTERARDITPALAALADANDRAFFGALTPQDHAQFRQLLARLLAQGGVAPAADWIAGPPP